MVVGEIAGERAHGTCGKRGQSRSRDAQGQREPAAQTDHVATCLGVLVHPVPAADPSQQIPGGALVQPRQCDALIHGQRGKYLAAGDQDSARRPTRRQRTHLLFTGGVVQDDQYTPVGRLRTELTCPSGLVIGDSSARYSQSHQEVTQDIAHGSRTFLRPIQVDEELAVGERRHQLMSSLHHDRCLADPARTVHQAHPAPAWTLSSLHQPHQLLAATGEIRHRRRQLTRDAGRFREKGIAMGEDRSVRRQQHPQLLNACRILTQSPYQTPSQQSPCSRRTARLLDQSRALLAGQPAGDPPVQPPQPVGHRLLHTLHRAIRQTGTQPLRRHDRQGDHCRHELLDRHRPPPGPPL